MEIYQNKIRIRACGIAIKGNQMLLIHLAGKAFPSLWLFPGGGVQFGESIPQAIEREFLEECNLKVKVSRFAGVYEYCAPPLHAIEHYFFIDSIVGDVLKGVDPEVSIEHQIIQEVQWMEWKDLLAIPSQELHGLFKHFKSIDELKTATPWYFKSHEPY